MILAFLHNTFIPFSLSFNKDPFLYEDKRYLLDRETPFRAYTLLKETLAAITYTYSEKQFFKHLTNELKNGFRKKLTNKNKLIFILPSLYSGGAERQACNLMILLKKRNFDVKLLTLSPLIGSCGHYLPLIEKENIPLIDMSENYRGIDFEDIKENTPKSILHLLTHSSPVIQRQIWPVFYRLYSENPNNVICFLDTPNLIGGIAASLAGVPNIVTSFRNINPTSFDFYEEWYLPYYKALIASPLLTMTGNSLNGNKSYSDWLAIKESHIKLLRNGVDFNHYHKPDKKSIDAIKLKLNISDDDFLIGGIFRLSEEKRPELFIETFIEVRKKLKKIKGFIVGEGPLLNQLIEIIKDKNLTNSLFLIGAVKDVSPYISIATIILQTSRTEGTANSLLEAQYLKKPVIATSGGGVAESLQHGKTGYIINSCDPKKIAQQTITLLQDQKTLDEMGIQGQLFVKNTFSLDKSVTQLLEYCIIDKSIKSNTLN